MRRARGALAARLADRDADAGIALMLVIMVMLVVATLGIMVTTAVVSQVRPAVFAQKDTRTVYAAETGLQTALSQLRTAAGGTYGDPSKLPCTMTGTATSSSTSASGALTYSVGVTYYSDDPTGKTAAQQQALTLTCTPGSGTSVVPAYALLQASGFENGIAGVATTSGNRYVQSLYTFKLDNTNVSGGLVYSFGGGYCLQDVPTGSGTPAAGDTVQYVASSSCVQGSSLQTWQWDKDYRIRLSSTVSTALGGLCLTGGFSGSTTVTLTSCSSSRYDQLFSFQGGSKFLGQNSSNTDYGTTCLWAGSQSTSLAGATLMSASGGCDSSDQAWGSFAPDARVGAGNAGKSTNQIVDYQQFGRCFDVTGQSISASFMILYPCKQDPSASSPSKIKWNQLISYTESSAPQALTTTTGGTTYCLTTPAAGASPAYVTFATCTAGDTTQQWVRTGLVTGNYAASYTFTDSTGRCLSVGPVWSGHGWSTIVAAPCDGTAGQKWNAPANAVNASVSGTRETLPTGSTTSGS